VLDCAFMLLLSVEVLDAGAALVLAAPAVAAADWSVAEVWLLTGGVCWAALAFVSVLVAGAVVLLAAAALWSAVAGAAVLLAAVWSAAGVLEEAMPGFAEVPLALLQVAETVCTLCNMMLSLLMLELLPVLELDALLELEAEGVTCPVIATVWLTWSFNCELSPVML
jgi:hypothetical protein